MKKSNYIILAIAAIAAAILLFVWYYLGFNHVDSPFDLMLAVVWWFGIVVIAAIIIRLEASRRRAIRTVYVSPTALYNSESGVVGLQDQSNIEAMQKIIEDLKYGFGKQDLPERAKFDYRYVVETDEFDGGDAEKGKEPTWKGTVTKIDRENGNTEIDFADEEELRTALTA